MGLLLSFFSCLIKSVELLYCFIYFFSPKKDRTFLSYLISYKRIEHMDLSTVYFTIGVCVGAAAVLSLQIISFFFNKYIYIKKG